MAIFFALKVGLGLALLRASTAQLDARGFVVFSQLFLWLALLSTISAAGVQSGLTRQVALAGGNAGLERRSFSAAGGIWLVSSLATVAASFMFRGPISRLLVGNETVSGTVPIVGIAAAIGGVGVLACAVLNGRQRAPTSLMVQSIGLIVGGSSCLLLLSRGNPVMAVLAYGAGAATTSILALFFVARRSRARPCASNDPTSDGKAASVEAPLEDTMTSASEIRLLLRYSLAFLATATVLPATLFALRGIYQAQFGTVLLSYWLAANRVSDVTSQLLGLYMGQIFLPQAARENDPSRLRRLVMLTFCGATAVMLTGWAVFALGAPFFTTTFLSASFLPAIPFISGYLLGDALRVMGSMTSNLTMAKGRPNLAALLEVVSAALIASTFMLGSWMEMAATPYLSYIAAFTFLSIAIATVLYAFSAQNAGKTE